MLTAHELHRVLRRILTTILEPDENGNAGSVTLQRERLADFALEHELDLQDTATIHRIAAGENYIATVYELKAID